MRPHFSYHFPNASGKVRRTCEQLRQRLEETTDSQVELYCGQEILYCGDTLRQIREGEALSMAGSRYFLMELLPFDSYAKIQGAVRSVSMLGKTVILAHVERYECLRKEGCVQELLQEGARLQMNYRPVGQKWYNETSRWCRKMLRGEKWNQRHLTMKWRLISGNCFMCSGARHCWLRRLGFWSAA